MNFTADITRIVFVHDRFQGHHVIAAAPKLACVHGIIHGNVANPFLWKDFADQLACVGIVASETAQVFGQHDIEFALFDFREHTLEAGAVLIHTGVSIVTENARHIPALFLTVAAQKFFLILNTGAGSFVGVVFGQTAVNGGFHLPRFGISIHSFIVHGNSPIRCVRRDLD